MATRERMKRPIALKYTCFLRFHNKYSCVCIRRLDEFADGIPYTVGAPILRITRFLLCCMKCRRGHSDENSVCLSVCPSAPKGISETQNGRFPCKIAIHLKKFSYKDTLCEYDQRQSCKAFTGLSIRAKMVRRDVPCYIGDLE